MPDKNDLKKVYLDTCVILPWFQNMMQNKRDKKARIVTPRIVQFLMDHPEIEKYISSFTIAELIEELMFKTDKIKPYMNKRQIVEDFVKAFRYTVPNLNIIELEKSTNGEEGLLIPVPALLDYTSLIGEVKDAIHVCIARHEDVYIVTKDDKIGRVQPVYSKTIGMQGFAKAFD